MGDVDLPAEERLMAAYARYDELCTSGHRRALVAARLELCLALLACGEELPPPVRSQMERDRAELRERGVITV